MAEQRSNKRRLLRLLAVAMYLLVVVVCVAAVLEYAAPLLGVCHNVQTRTSGV